ncbi:Chromosome-associated kinesin KIF4 [Frankliniella fusca]|uniref:Chromosome-associated kinesin KIF4 n=1 Tax=Frankliniella fusca TaxID=407009 RepID=A0AAE1GVX5_9NEOP|nr:Chromosome-associated kinesin KIF4 [Frankliniella fusca]
MRGGDTVAILGPVRDYSARRHSQSSPETFQTDSTRNRRARGFAPVRRVIKNGNVPLPKDFKNFLALSENKSDLTRFLSEEAMKNDFGSLEVLVAGGFSEETRVDSTNKARDLTDFEANHEEADTRMVLHAVQSGSEAVVVSARDTDVKLLFIHHFERIKCKECWIMCGSKYIPIHELCKELKPEQISNLLAFHAITGCDTSSKIASVTKTGAWKNFNGQTCKLLSGLGETTELASDEIEKIEEFVVQALYKVVPDILKAVAARIVLFGTVKRLECLPPTNDALNLHILRCHRQVFVWKNAHVPYPELPDPKSCGWKMDGGRYVPVLMTLPSVPKSCPEFTVCGCKGQCNTKQCGCRKDPWVPCMKLCKCKGNCLNGNAEEKDDF